MFIYLSICLSIYPSVHLPIYLPIYLAVYRSIYLSIYLASYLPIFLSTYLPIYLSIQLSIYLSIYLSSYLSICPSIYLSIYLSNQKWSDTEVFCALWLRNVLRAATACTFSTSQLPKVVRHWGVLYMFTSKCASRHNGLQFFISHLASWLRTRRSEPQIIGKTQCFAFRASLLTLSLLLFSLVIFLFSLPLPCF